MRRRVGSSKEKLLNCAYVPEPISSAAEADAKANPASEHFMATLRCSGRRRIQLRHPQTTHPASPPKMKATTILSAMGPMVHIVNLSHLLSVAGVIGTDGKDNWCNMPTALHLRARSQSQSRAGEQRISSTETIYRAIRIRGLVSGRTSPICAAFTPASLSAFTRRSFSGVEISNPPAVCGSKSRALSSSLTVPS